MSNPYGDHGQYGEYGAPNPYDPYRSSAPTDGVSIAALVCSLTCCAAPVGIGLAIAGIVRTRDGKRSGRWAAITGLVVGILLMVAMVAFVVFAAVMGSRTVWEDEASVGQCVNIDFIDDLTKSRCNEPHEAEIIWVDRFDDESLAMFDSTSIDGFCRSRALSPEHRAAVDSDDYVIDLSTDAFDEAAPDVGDWYVCYVERADGEDLDGPLSEGEGPAGA